MKALYFAWVRERIGLAEEEIAPPPGVAHHRRSDGLAARPRRRLRRGLRR